MSPDRDPQITVLLDQLESPPAPSPTFWDELRDELEGGPRVMELRPVQADRRRPSRRVVVALVAAAVVAAAAVGITRLSRDDDRERVVPANPTTTLPEGQSLVSSTVTTWIRYLVDGNAEAAWEMVGSESRGFVDRAAFDGMVADLKATWSPWNATGVRRHVLQLPSPREDLSVVSMRDDQHRSVQALVVRDTGTQLQVEPFLPGTALSLVSLPFDATGQGNGLPYLTPQTTIQLHVEADATSALVAIDGAPISPDGLLKDATGAIVGVVGPTKPLLHDVLVVEVASDGTVAVVDQLFEIAS